MRVTCGELVLAERTYVPELMGGNCGLVLELRREHQSVFSPGSIRFQDVRVEQ